MESPPLWMTVGWFNYLPADLKERVWNEPGELDRLLKKVEEAAQKRN